ncbi:microfibril-associated glycoprotein 4-like [Amphiura filiformis]|uniref:microfibril-associated glycoprotein 4-like n=1 Tax=Amphiura filiformis TaxID=82378 RepID=UPI003B20E9E8
MNIGLTMVISEPCILGNVMEDGEAMWMIPNRLPCRCTQINLGGFNVVRHASVVGSNKTATYNDLDDALNSQRCLEKKEPSNSLMSTASAAHDGTSVPLTTPASSTSVTIQSETTRYERSQSTERLPVTTYNIDCNYENANVMDMDTITFIWRFYERKIADGIYRIQATKSNDTIILAVSNSSVIIQRRFDGSLSFNRTLTEYENGFGCVNSEFWIGFHIIKFVNAFLGLHKLHVYLEDWDDSFAIAKYETFDIGTDQDGYLATISSYAGVVEIDELQFSNGMRFSTWDNDNDTLANENCASKCSGGWWYNSCECNINSMYQSTSDMPDGTGLHWMSWRPDYSLRKTELTLYK